MIVSQRFLFLRDRDRIQTCNRLIRSQLLYSVELRGQSLYKTVIIPSDPWLYIGFVCRATDRMV